MDELIQIRKDRGWTQLRMAEWLGITARHLRRIEKGYVKMPKMLGLIIEYERVKRKEDNDEAT